MIKAFIFDLDGTLVETEELKARAYAATLQNLLHLEAPDQRAIALYERGVGSTDEMICRSMIRELELEDALESLPTEEPWQALHRVRMGIYRDRFGTPDAIRGAAYSHALDLLTEQKRAGRLVAVATSSFTDEAVRVLEALGVADVLAEIVGRDQVEKSKPDPEIYVTTMGRLGVAPGEVVIVEDSLIGAQAARASGARWICVATRFSASALRRQPGLDQSCIVYDPAELADRVDQLLASI